MQNHPQLSQLFTEFDRLHALHGSAAHAPVYGAGETRRPKLCLVFMNPTARNISADPDWPGLRAPWLGTKPVWRLLTSLKLLDSTLANQIDQLKPGDWTPALAQTIYQDIALHSVYITNLAKCTQPDARPLTNKVMREYRTLMLKELDLLNPQAVVTFGNQVSSVIIGKSITVSNYPDSEYEELTTNNFKHLLFPTYYPIGQGTRNLLKAVSRIRKIQRSLR